MQKLVWDGHCKQKPPGRIYPLPGGFCLFSLLIYSEAQPASITLYGLALLPTRAITQ
jgi:hypothetical protein